LGELGKIVFSEGVKNDENVSKPTKQAEEKGFISYNIADSAKYNTADV
jgi:hypothetical protein